MHAPSVSEIKEFPRSGGTLANLATPCQLPCQPQSMLAQGYTGVSRSAYCD